MAHLKHGTHLGNKTILKLTILKLNISDTNSDSYNVDSSKSSDLTFSQDKNVFMDHFNKMANLNKVANLTIIAGVLIKKRPLIIPNSQFLTSTEINSKILVFCHRYKVQIMVAGIGYLAIYALLIFRERSEIRSLKLDLEREEARIQKKLNQNARGANEQERHRLSLIQKVLNIRPGGAVINGEVESLKQLEKETMAIYRVLSGTGTIHDLVLYQITQETIEKELAWHANLESVLKVSKVSLGELMGLKRKDRFKLKLSKIKASFQKFKLKTRFQRVRNRVRNRVVKTKDWVTSPGPEVVAIVVAILIILSASEGIGHVRPPRTHSLSPTISSTRSLLIKSEDLKLVDSRETIELKPEMKEAALKQDITEKSISGRSSRVSRVPKKRYKTLADLPTLPEFSEIVEEVQSPMNNPIPSKIRVKE